MILMMSFIGWKVGGLPTAIASGLAIFGPSCAACFAVFRLWERFRERAWQRIVRRGLAPVTIGLVVAGGYVMAVAGDVGWLSGGVSAAAAALLRWTRINPLLLLAAGGALGGRTSLAAPNRPAVRICHSRPYHGPRTVPKWSEHLRPAQACWPQPGRTAMVTGAKPGAAMPIIPEVLDYLDELSLIRRDIHAHPEIGFQEQRTSEVVATKLAEYGCEVHRGLATTGVIGTLRRGNSLRAIGLRADMDCLPMQELNEFAHRSTHDGQMHACGHDGHTTMLLGAARYLAATCNFEGTVHFIFQPGEEGFGGGRVMVQQGLFDKFPCDAVFAMHNKPGIPIGTIATRTGPMLAASDRFDILIKAQGGHAAHPHLGTDPFVIGAQIVMGLQTIPSRNIDPVDSAVISIGFMRGGSAYNVIPDELHIGGTVRSFRPEVRDLLERRMGEVARGTAALHGATAELDYRRGYPPTINHADEAAFAADVAAEICGEECVERNIAPSLGGEDFSYMLLARPGAMMWIGNGPGEGGCLLHNARYDFNDSALPYGVSFFARLAERFLAPQQG
jgi:hippurate hydrolase